MLVTMPARTALDLACRYQVDSAVAQIDALARATKLKMADVELLVDRYRGRHGLKSARVALDLVDAGAESPRETWLEVVAHTGWVSEAADPDPGLQRVRCGGCNSDMGWEDINVGVDYEGIYHWNSRTQIDHDIRRFEEVTESGWIYVRVTARETEAGVIRRVAAARARRL